MLLKCKLHLVASKVYMNSFGVHLLCVLPNVVYAWINLGASSGNSVNNVTTLSASNQAHVFCLQRQAHYFILNSFQQYWKNWRFPPSRELQSQWRQPSQSFDIIFSSVQGRNKNGKVWQIESIIGLWCRQNKPQPEGERVMPETRFTEFPALSVDLRVGIFWFCIGDRCLIVLFYLWH